MIICLEAMHVTNWFFVLFHCARNVRGIHMNNHLSSEFEHTEIPMLKSIESWAMGDQKIEKRITIERAKYANYKIYWLKQTPI